MSKRRLSQQQQQRIEQRRRGDQQHQTATEGLVIMNAGKKASVRLLSNQQLVSCHQRANLDNVVAGDKVMISFDNTGNAVIESRLERRSLLSRPGFRGVIKPIAANVDQLLLVIAPTPGIDLELLDRSLCYCEWQGIEAVIVLNKVELLDEAGLSLVNELAQIYRAMGYRWLETSSLQQQGISELAELCQHKSSVFLGNSGVGKSSLTKALIPDIDIRTQALSSTTGLGQHTTNNATLYDLPAHGQIIDAAGIRSLNLQEFSIEYPYRYWRDFQPYLGKCRFHNCTHEHEPGCAIKDAVDMNLISELRYIHYLRLLNESIAP